VAKIILVPSDRRTVLEWDVSLADVNCGCCPLPLTDTLEGELAKSDARSISGGPFHEVIVAPCMRPGFASYNSISGGPTDVIRERFRVFTIAVSN
jgi:hypothetical protein